MYYVVHIFYENKVTEQADGPPDGEKLLLHMTIAWPQERFPTKEVPYVELKFVHLYEMQKLILIIACNCTTYHWKPDPKIYHLIPNRLFVINGNMLTIASEPTYRKRLN